MTVPARVSLVTLGVRDLARSTRFYETLGWKPAPNSVAGEVTFFATAGGLLALYGLDALARDAGLEPPAQDAFRGVTLAINVEARADVDAVVATAEAAGARVDRPAAATDWGGYIAYFSDPDGHVWEVAHNPGWPIGADGRPALPSR